jgi:hypothetical protein
MSEISYTQLFDSSVKDLRSQPDEYSQIRLQSSEYRPAKYRPHQHELPVAVIGGVLIDRAIDYVTMYRTSPAKRYGLAEERLEEHLNHAANEVKRFIGKSPEKVASAMIDADVYELLPPLEGDSRFVCGVQAYYHPKANKLRSVFAYDQNLDDAHCALRSFATEHALRNDLIADNPVHIIAEHAETKRELIPTLGMMAAACIMPDKQIEFSQVAFENSQN